MVGVVAYGDDDNIVIECEDCGEILVSFDNVDTQEEENKDK